MEIIATKRARWHFKEIETGQIPILRSTKIRHKDEDSDLDKYKYDTDITMSKDSRHSFILTKI